MSYARSLRLRSAPSPIASIGLGIVLVGVFCWLWSNIYLEYRGMGDSPVLIDLDTVPTPTPDRGKWVRIPQIDVECGNTVEDIGRNPHTYYTAHAPGSSRTVVVDMGEGRASCQYVPRMNISGVIRPLVERRRRFFEGRGLHVNSGSAALLLTPGETPTSSKVLLWVLPFIAVFGLSLIGMGLSQLRRRPKYGLAFGD